MSGALRRPFREQVAFFRRKLGNLVPTRRWDDIDRSQHDTAFMVAGAQKADLLADLAASVDRAIAEGKSLDAFRKDFAAAVERHDWHGWTGEDTKAGRAWRTRTIYRTNASVSYAAGRRAQLEAKGFPFWVYRHGGSKNPRPEHLELDGLVLPSDHPAWSWLYPPSDWGCSCYVLGARSARGARRLGGDPDKLPPAWFGELDHSTGAPVGVGKGWDYAPGASVTGAVNAVAGKIGSWDYQIAKAYMGDLAPEQRDALADAYRRLPSVADDARRYARRALGDGGEAVVQPVWTLGPVTSADAALVSAAKRIDVAGFDFALMPDDIVHVRNQHGDESERRRGQIPVSADTYARLPEIISSPDVREDGGTSDTGEPLIRLEKTIDGARHVAFFKALNRRRSLALKTFYVIGRD